MKQEMNVEIIQDPYVDNRLRSNKPTNYLGFIDELIRLWKLAGKRGRFIRDTPLKDVIQDDDNNILPVITYRKLRRQYTPEFKERKPRHRATIRHPERPDEWIDLFGQMFDIWVEFDVYAASAEEADEIAEELDDFLFIYKGFFKAHGVHEIMFYAQLQDKVITDYKYPIACRPIQYTMRFEKITPLFLNQIRQMLVQAEVVQPNE